MSHRSSPSSADTVRADSDIDYKVDQLMERKGNQVLDDMLSRLDTRFQDKLDAMSDKLRTELLPHSEEEVRD